MKSEPVSSRTSALDHADGVVTASAPCRVDVGGTLDLSTFAFPLMVLNPCTFNLALDLRTRVRVSPFEKGYVQVTSKGFDPACFPSGSAPYTHAMGLMFAIADYFKADGVAVEIDSASPPRSALGGSSVAAVALIAALARRSDPGPRIPATRKQIALLANRLESMVARTPCGVQDHLAAAYGGVNLWTWLPGFEGREFSRKVLVRKSQGAGLEKHLLFAYCGNPHESLDVNGRWVSRFLSGECRRDWEVAVACTRNFAKAFEAGDWTAACGFMNQETLIRLAMTPDVLDPVGLAFFAAAQESGCGARFAGAGGGGCVWALGGELEIQNLESRWKAICSRHENSRILEAAVDWQGLQIQEI